MKKWFQKYSPNDKISLKRAKAESQKYYRGAYDKFPDFFRTGI